MTCGGGTRARSRICINGEIGSPGCTDAAAEVEACSQQVKILKQKLI